MRRSIWGLQPMLCFLIELHQMISYVDDEKEFEYSSDHMMRKCFSNKHMSEVSWLNMLYSNRKHWSGAWVKSNFTAGKTTTQLSEQFNAFARHYLSPDLSFCTFFARFQDMIDELRYNESTKEFAIMNSAPFNLYKRSRLMLHATRTFTPKIFDMLHEQYLGKCFDSIQNIG